MIRPPMFLFALALAVSSQASSDCIKPAITSPAQQFDFLVGQHEVTLHAWLGDTWSPARPINARWNGWRGLQGRAIYDEWFDPDPGRNSMGVNVRLYDADENIWKMMWISTADHEVKELRAQMRDEVLTMWQVHPPREGWKAEFKQLDEARWAREDFSLSAGLWRPGFRLVATRIDCRSEQNKIH